MTDAHFGHLVPVAFLSFWNVFVTASFNAKTRKGISNIEELSTRKLSKEEIQELKHVEEVEEEKDPLDIESSDSEYGHTGYDKPKKKKSKAFESRLQFFENQLKLEEKGGYRVWQTVLSILGRRKAVIYLHAINDSKPVYRITTRYAALPLVPLIMTAYDQQKEVKVHKEIQTTGAHKCFRENMGFNDQSDAKRSLLKLSSKYYPHWPKHMLGKTIEDAIINSYLNYLLDPNCITEG